MKYLSLFSGIGGFELGIQQAYEKLCIKDIPQTTEWEKENKATGNTQGQCSKQSDISSTGFTCIGYSEIDKYATAIYQKHFPYEECEDHTTDRRQGKESEVVSDRLESEPTGELPKQSTSGCNCKHKNYGDITKLDPSTLPDFDLLVGGFPCQAFSIAGKRLGFADTRGTLFFDIARILKEKQPRLLLLENVKGLLSHDEGRTFKTIISTLTELGYDLQWQVLNSKNHGVPQNRERVFIVGHLRGTGRPEVFPFGGNDSQDIPASEIREIHEPFPETHRLSDAFRIRGTNGTSATLKGEGGGMGAKTGLYAIPVLTPDRIEKRQNGRRFKEDGEPSFTLTGQDKHGVYDGMKIRRLTPTECERLQGFPDGWTEGISDTQRYKCLGNAVTVNVIQDIIQKLL